MALSKGDQDPSLQLETRWRQSPPTGKQIKFWLCTDHQGDFAQVTEAPGSSSFPVWYMGQCQVQWLALLLGHMMTPPSPPLHPLKRLFLL